MNAQVDQQTAATATEPMTTQALIQRELEKFRQQQEARLSALEARLPQDKVALVVFSDDMDKVLAGFVIANGALAMGMEVSMYFTFWGLTAIKKDTNLKGKALKQRMMALMTPGKSEEMGISKLNMLGMGPRMMRSLMKEKNVASLEELRDIAQEMGTRMIGCTMAMDVMGVEAGEFVDGIELGGVATFMEEALKSRMTIFL
jgi:peroxiredoxin family protein